MSESVEFDIDLRDRASDALDSIRRSTDKTKKSLDNIRKAQAKANQESKASANAYNAGHKAANKAIRANKAMGRSIHDLTRQLKRARAARSLIGDKDVARLGKYNRLVHDLEKRISRMHRTGMAGSNASAGIGRSTGRARGRISGNVLGRFNIGAIGATAAMTAITGLFQKGAASSYDRARFVNEFGGRGNELFDSLNAMRSSLGEGGMASGKSLARGGFRGAGVTSTLKRLADVANGDEGKLSGLADTFARINKEGHLTRDTLAELDAKGFKPLLERNRTTNESFKSLFDRLDRGKVSIAEVRKALESATSEGGRFFGNMNRLAMTSQGQWDKLKNSISGFFTSLGEQMSTKVAPYLMGINSFLERGSGTSRKESTYKSRVPLVMGEMTKEAWDKWDGKSPTKKFQSKMLDWMDGGKFSKDGTFSSREDLYNAQLRRDEAAKNHNDRINAVSGGGVRNVTITIGKMIETMTNQFTGGMRENAPEIGRIVNEELVKALASASGR